MARGILRGMSNISLHPGAWSGALGLIFSGVFAILSVPQPPFALFATGVLCIGAGCSIAIWALKLKGQHWWRRVPRWLSRNVWWRFRLRPPPEDSPPFVDVLPSGTKSVPSAPMNEWIPLHKALHYLVYDSFWARKQLQPETEEDFNQIVLSEFRERLARGEVRARGAKGVAFSDEGKPTEEIPLHYWIDGFFLPHGVVVLADVKQDAVGNPKEEYSYRRVIIHRGSLEAVWPPSNMTGLTPLSVFVEPLRKKISDTKIAKFPGIASLPDITLNEVIDRIMRQRGLVDDGSPEALAIIRDIGRDIGDQMSLRRLSTWGRRNGTLELLPYEISRKGMGIGRDSKGNIYHHLQYRDESDTIRNVMDFRFLRSEIEVVWPDV